MFRDPANNLGASLPASLKQALSIAAAYAPPKADGVAASVILSPGIVRAYNGHAGCEIPVTGLEVTAIVNCAALRKMCDALGDAAALTVDMRGKLTIQAGATRYGVQSLKAEDLMPHKEVPEGPWLRVNADVVRAIQATATLVGKDEARFALSGIRMTPSWIASANGQSMAVAWAAGIVTENITVPAGIFDSLTGEIDIHVAPRVFWIREVETQQARWVSTIEGEWPDTIVTDVLSSCRAQPDRISFAVDAAQVLVLAQQADVIADGLGRTIKMTLSPKALAFDKRGTGKAGDSEFHGSVPIDAEVPTNVVVGMEPGQVARACKAISAVTGGADGHSMSVSGPMYPVVVWGGSPIIVEALVMPAHLGGEAAPPA